VKRKITSRSALAAGSLALNVTFLLLSAPSAVGQASELRVLASAGMKPAVTALLLPAEHSIGQRVATEFDASKTLKQRIQAGAAFDVAILTGENIDDLVRQRKIAANTRSDVARTGIGVGIRAGAAKPDISTPEALKRTLLNARSITLNPNGASTAYFYQVLARLGITEEAKSKFILDTSLERLQFRVAEGRAELLIALIPEILDSRGVELAGPLPGDLQSYVNFAAGVATNTHNAAAAKALLRFITAPAAAPILKAKGLEPR
jgi:molybdate transport system substrate-binding protein